MNTITIKALLKTRAPLHIAHPNNMRMDNSGNVIYTKDGFPCTAIQRLQMPVTASASAEGGQLKSYPVIAGNNIAGGMRRYAGRLVIKALRARGQKVNLAAYSILLGGAATGNPDSNDKTYAEHVASRQHPYFGLFGGGPKMFARRMRVHNSLPVTPATTDLKGPLAHPFAAEHATNDNTRLTAVWGFRRVDDLRDLSNIDIAEASVENFHEEFEKRQALILAAKQTKDDGEDAGKDKNSTKAYNAIEFVLPGVVFDLTMELDVATDAQIGLYLETLDSFAATERLGGNARNGFGVFSFESIQLSSENGNVERLFDNGRLVRTEPKVAAWLKAWEDAAKDLSAEQINAMIAVKPKASQEEKDARKAEKTAAKAAKTAAGA